MRPARYLPNLRRSAVRRLGVLKRIVENKQPPCSAVDDRELAFAAIEVATVWSSFVRSYYLSCALGARLGNGTMVTVSPPGILNTFDAMQFAVALLKKKTLRPNWHPLDEPTWRLPSTLLRLSTAIGFSHSAQITTAFSVPTSVFDDLPKFRNFYAHRGKSTFQGVAMARSQRRMQGPAHPTAVMATCLPGRPQNLISDWCDEIRITVELLCL